MKIRVTLDVELEVKSRFCKVVTSHSSDRGTTAEEVWTTPTDADIQDYITKSLNGAKDSFKHENNFVPCRLLDFSVKETALDPR